MGNIKKILGYMKNGKTYEELKKRFGEDVDLEFSRLLSDEMIYSSYHDKFELTPKGIEFLRKYTIRDPKYWIPIVLPIIISVIMTFTITSWQLQQNRELTSTIEPRLDFYLNTRNNVKELQLNKLATVYNSDYRTNYSIDQGEQITLCMKNLGQTPSGHVTAEMANNWSTGTIWNFDSLKLGDEPICETEVILAMSCGKKVPVMNYTSEECDKSGIPTGLTELEFIIHCTNCEIGKKIDKRPLSVCVWENNSAICDSYNRPK